MAAPLYRPPTRVTTVQIPWETLVVRADPTFNRFKHWEVEYEFTRRQFWNNPYVSGPYSGTSDNPDIPVGKYIVNNESTINNVYYDEPD